MRLKEDEKNLGLIMKASTEENRLISTDQAADDVEYRFFNLEELPISAASRQSLRVWCAIYKTAYSSHDFPWPKFSSDEEFDFFDQEGLRIWQKIIEELKPEYKLYYYSERQEGLFRVPGLPMVRRINLEPDYRCYPIWGVDDVGDFPPEDLPLKPETIQHLYAWAEKYDASLDWNDPGKGWIWSQAEEGTFMQEGFDLWQKIKHELSPEYEVYYCLSAPYIRLPNNN